MGALINTAAAAADTAAIDKRVAATLERFYTLSDQNKSLAQDAAAVLVFPEHDQGAFQEN